MKTIPITIIPDSGVLLAGRLIKSKSWADSIYAVIKFVGQDRMVVRYKGYSEYNGSSGGEAIYDISTYEQQTEWLEVLPDGDYRPLEIMTFLVPADPFEKLPQHKMIQKLVEKINEIIERVNDMEGK